MEYADSLWAHLGGTDEMVTNVDEVDEWMEKILDEAEDDNLDTEGVDNDPLVETSWNEAARHRAFVRTATGEPDFIEAARRIVANGTYEKVDGVLFDLFSASAVLAVWENISDANKEKFTSIGFPAIVPLCFKLLEKAKAASKTALKSAAKGDYRCESCGYEGNTQAADGVPQACPECGGSSGLKKVQDRSEWKVMDAAQHMAGAPTIANYGPPEGTPQAEVDAYWNWVGQMAADSDSGYYVPLAFDSWRRTYWKDDEGTTTYAPGLPPMASSRHTAGEHAMEIENWCANKGLVKKDFPDSLIDAAEESGDTGPLEAWLEDNEPRTERWNDDAYNDASPNDSDGYARTSRRRTAGEVPEEFKEQQKGSDDSDDSSDSGKTCSVCGDAIAQTDGDWHHDNGEKHDHEAKPGSDGDSKESRRKVAATCVCAQNSDGSVTTMLCPLHASEDPCWTMAQVTGGRRRGSIVNGVCTNCGWSGGGSKESRRRVAGVTLPARAQRLISWLENNSSGANDDDQVMELGQILSGLGYEWYYENDYHIRVVPADQYAQAGGDRARLNQIPDVRTASRKQAVRSLSIEQVRAGDVLVPKGGSIDRARNTVRRVARQGNGFVVEFTNGTATPPLAKGAVMVHRAVADAKAECANCGQRILGISNNDFEGGYRWYHSGSGDEICEGEQGKAKPAEGTKETDFEYTGARKQAGNYRVQFAGIGENVWSGNGLTFETEAEAAEYAKDKLMVWGGADVGRVVLVSDGHKNHDPTDPVVLTDPRIVVNYRTATRKQAADENDVCTKCGKNVKANDSGDDPWKDSSGSTRCPDGQLHTTSEQKESRKQAAGTISDSQHPWTLSPDDEYWIGNFTDDAINEAFEFWTSDAGRNAQPNLPGYADVMVRHLTDERARRSSMRKKAAGPRAAVAGDGAYVTDQYNSGIRHEVAPGTMAHGRLVGYTMFGESYAWSVDGIDGDMWNLGGRWTEAKAATRKTARAIWEIADEIRRDWKNVYFGAVPYLDAMRQIDSLADNYGMDDARSIVLYFLSNATTWRGEKAKEIKAELKGMLKSAAVGDDNDNGTPDVVEQLRRVVRDPENPRGLYGDNGVVLSEVALERSDEKREKARATGTTAARSDYAHWNEDADAVWWAEEGSQAQYEGENATEDFYDDWSHDDDYEDDEEDGVGPFDAARHEAMPNPVDLGVAIGDIFVSSWGHEQTNVDFYEVTGLTGASVRVRPIAKDYVETGFMSGTSTPRPGQYTGPEFLRRIQGGWRGEPGFSPESYSWARKWDGQPERESHYA